MELVSAHSNLLLVLRQSSKSSTHNSYSTLIYCCVTPVKSVREHLSDEQIQTASLLQECIMVRDSLAHLPDVLTAGDMSDIVRYLCMC